MRPVGTNNPPPQPIITTALCRIPFLIPSLAKNIAQAVTPSNTSRLAHVTHFCNVSRAHSSNTQAETRSKARPHLASTPWRSIIHVRSSHPHDQPESVKRSLPHVLPGQRCRHSDCSLPSLCLPLSRRFLITQTVNSILRSRYLVLAICYQDGRPLPRTNLSPIRPSSTATHIVTEMSVSDIFQAPI